MDPRYLTPYNSAHVEDPNILAKPLDIPTKPKNIKAVNGAPFTAFIFLGLVGISNGFANILGSSTWAELYGVKYLGSIKALTTALMVFATAFGTALFGFLIDIGFTVEGIAVVSGTYIFISLILLFLVRNKLNPVII